MYKDKVLVIVHIPKTAGSSLTTAIMPHYKQEEVFIENDTGIFPTPDKKVIIGHNRFGRYEALGPLHYVTMLRNPIDRVISHYYYLKNVVPETTIANTVSIEEFSRSIWVTNLHTQYLTGGKQDFELAIHNLKTFAFFGITELFHESLYLMEQKLGFTNIKYSKINVNPLKQNRETLPLSTLKEIKEANLIDMKVYNWARMNFEKRLSMSDWHKQ